MAWASVATSLVFQTPYCNSPPPTLESNEKQVDLVNDPEGVAWLGRIYIVGELLKL